MMRGSFNKHCQKNEILVKIEKITDTFHLDLHACLLACRNELVKRLSEKSESKEGYREKCNTFYSHKFFR